MDLSKNDIHIRDRVVEIIESLISNHKKLSISPQDLLSLSKALIVLSKYPKETIEGYIDISSTASFQPRSFLCSSVNLHSDSFELSLGGNEYSEGVGSDSFTTLFYTSGCDDELDSDSLKLWEESFLSYIDENVEGLEIEDCSELLGSLE